MMELRKIGAIFLIGGSLSLSASGESKEMTDPATSPPVSNADQGVPTSNSEPAHAQSWIPFTTNGYVGISAGRVSYDLNCVPGFSCDDTGTGFKLFTGGKLWNVVGLEFSYFEFGKVDNAGGTTRARGIDLSLVGNLPLTERFSLFGKVGSTYAQTRVSASAPSVAFGKERGFGLSYGAGLNYDFATNWGVRAEWERHRLDFIGSNKDVDLVSVGVNYRF